MHNIMQSVGLILIELTVYLALHTGDDQSSLYSGVLGLITFHS